MKEQFDWRVFFRALAYLTGLFFPVIGFIAFYAWFVREYPEFE